MSLGDLVIKVVEESQQSLASYKFNESNGTAVLKEIPEGYEVPKTIQKGNRIYEVIVEGQKQ